LTIPSCATPTIMPSTEEFSARPELLAGLTPDLMYTMPRDTVAAIQLAGLRKRFSDMAGKVRVLERLADEQKTSEIHNIEDGAVLLFPHSFYKAYPLSILENNRFDRLTRWLDGLTTSDLSSFDASSYETIDDWIDGLDRNTDVHVVHSSGTSGKLSFLPRGTPEIDAMAAAWPRGYTGFGDEPNNPLTGIETMPVILPNFRRGGLGPVRMLDGVVRHVYDGHEDMIIALNPGRMSADMLSLGGRIRAAEAKGELGAMQMSPQLLARRDAFLADMAAAPARRSAFFARVAEEYRGRRVVLLGNWIQHYDIATEALAKGIANVFSPESLLMVVGGMKGRKLPDDYKDVISAYLGVKNLRSGYGMSESVALHPACPRGNYHLQPWIIPFLLDPKTGEPRPRSGTQEGRYGFIDLLAQTHWGGFLTGDAVTLSWGDTEPCNCGRLGPYVHSEVRRYSEIEGGDDKVTCAGAPEAHDKALSFLTELA
jgi:hypothetical protein